MIIEVDTQKMVNANEFGEILRRFCFKEEYGCYSCFDLIDGFLQIPVPEELKKYLWEDCKNVCYVRGEIFVAWGWEGDGCLVIKEGNKIARNSDCKKDYLWEWAQDIEGEVMSERQDIKVEVMQRSIYGSIVKENKYNDDTVTDVIGYLQKLLATIPAEHRDRAFVSFESAGGYEGSHSAEFGVYYYRPETDVEMTARTSEIKRREDSQRAFELEQRKRLNAKYGNQSEEGGNAW